MDLKFLKKEFPDYLRTNFDSITTNFFKVTDVDLTDAVENLIRIQSIYNLKTDDLIQGIVGGEKLSQGLTPHDVFVIGKEASKMKNQDYLTQDYLHKVWTDVDHGVYTEKDVDERDIMLTLVAVYNRTGQFQRAINTIDILVRKYEDFKRLLRVKTIMEDYREKLGESAFNLPSPFNEAFQRDGKFSSEKEEIIYKQACRYNFKRTSKDESRLACGFVYRYKSPFTRLAQFKIEEVNMNPYVIIFHDVLSDREAGQLKEVSKSKLRWAARNSGSVEKSGWLPKEVDEKVLGTIEQRVEVSWKTA
jgi:prolyl 4-hydroxylase